MKSDHVVRRWRNDLSRWPNHWLPVEGHELYVRRTRTVVRLLLVIGACMPFLACTPPASPPAMPMLVSGKLIGSQACGNFPIHQRTLSFTCGPLPTTAQTGWQLKPLLKPPNSQGTQYLNRVVILTVSSATATNLNVIYVAEDGVHRWPMRAIPDGPGEPGPVSPRHEYAWAASDDGTTKTWTLKFVLDSCTTDVEVRMSATNAAGSSGPLSAFLMRDPNELECTSSGGAGPSVSTTGPRSSNGRDPSSDSCPGGGTPRTFGVCENCASGHPASMNRWSAGEYCDEAELRAVYGYTDPLLNPTPKAQICTIRIEPIQENCEKP